MKILHIRLLSTLKLHILILFAVIFLISSSVYSQNSTAIKNWLEKFTSEYSDLNLVKGGRKGPLRGESLRFANLFIGENFKLVKNKPYLELSKKNQIKLRYKIYDYLKKQPLSNKNYHNWLYKQTGLIGSSLNKYIESSLEERATLKTLRTNLLTHNWSLEKLMDLENGLQEKIMFLWPSEQKEFENQVLPKLIELVKLKLIEEANAIDVRFPARSDLLKLTNFRNKHSKEYKLLGYTFPPEIYEVLDQKSNEVFKKLTLKDLREYNNIKYTGNLSDLETMNNAYTKFRDYWTDINPNFKPLAITLQEMHHTRVKLRDQFMPQIESEIKNSKSSEYIKSIINSTYIGTGMSDKNYQKILQLQADQELYIEELRMKAVIANDNKNKALTSSGYGYIPLSFWDNFEQGQVLYDVFYGDFSSRGMPKSEEFLLIFFTNMIVDNSRNCLKDYAGIYGGLIRTRTETKRYSSKVIHKDTIVLKPKYEDTFKKNGFNEYSNRNNAIAFWGELLNPNSSAASMGTAMHKDTKEYIKFRSKINCDCLSFDQMLDNIWRVLNGQPSLQRSKITPKGKGCN